MRYRLRERALARPLAELDQHRWLFDNLLIDPTHAEWLRRRAWVRTIHGTARIEGNTASEVEVEALLRGEGATTVSGWEAREIIGTRDALSLPTSWRLPAPTPDGAVMRELHRRVLWCQSPLLTAWRVSPGREPRSRRDGQPRLDTPPSDDVPELMRQLSAWLADAAARHPPPVVAVLAILELVAIHPFNDGTGEPSPEGRGLHPPDRPLSAEHDRRPRDRGSGRMAAAVGRATRPVLRGRAGAAQDAGVRRDPMIAVP